MKKKTDKTASFVDDEKVSSVAIKRGNDPVGGKIVSSRKPKSMNHCCPVSGGP